MMNGTHHSRHSRSSSELLAAQNFKVWKNKQTVSLCFAITFSDKLRAAPYELTWSRGSWHDANVTQGALVIKGGKCQPRRCVKLNKFRPPTF